MILLSLAYISAVVGFLVGIVKGLEYLCIKLSKKPLHFFILNLPIFLKWLGRKLEEQADTKRICTDTKLEEPSYISAFLLFSISVALLLLVGIYSFLVIMASHLPFLSYIGMLFCIICLMYFAAFYRAEAMRQIYVH